MKVKRGIVEVKVWSTVEFAPALPPPGYVFVGLEGASFCSACKQTFLLLAAFPAQAAVNGMVKGLLLLLMGWSTPARVRVRRRLSRTLTPIVTLTPTLPSTRPPTLTPPLTLSLALPLPLPLTRSTPFLCAAACFFSLEADASYLAKGYQPVYAAVVVFATSFVVANGIAMFSYFPDPCPNPYPCPYLCLYLHPYPYPYLYPYPYPYLYP